MRKASTIMACFVTFMALFATTATAQSVSWRQIVGIIPAGNVVGSGTGKIPGGFLPWTTTSGSAHVDLKTGQIEFKVRGLVFAGAGNGILLGAATPVTAVKGALICDADGSAGGGNSVIVETPSVPLTESGDAQFGGNIGPLPAVCASETDIAFVVRASAFNGSATEGPWIGNGASIIRHNDGEEDKQDK